jgi:capsid portal protein
MMIMVSNGQLTTESIKRLEDFVETQIQGSDNFSKFIIIEAEPTGDTFDGTDNGIMKMSLEKLKDQQMADAMFLEYGNNNRRDIREAFRLSPLYTGASDDFTKATADASRRVVDEQVFDPERRTFDEWINRFMMTAFDAVHHMFTSLGPNVTDDQDIIQIMSTGERSGAITPRIAREMISDVLGRDLPPVSDDLDPDVPFSLQMAEKVKNMAGSPPGSTPGETVTALKRKSPYLGNFFEQVLELRKDLEAEEEARMMEAARANRSGEKTDKSAKNKKR